jgi:hypothetical protein
VQEDGGTYLTSAVNDLPLQTLVRADLWLADDKGDELDFGVFAMLARLVDGAVCIVREVLVVDGPHVGFRDEVECLWDSEDFDCTTW